MKKVIRVIVLALFLQFFVGGVPAHASTQITFSNLSVKGQTAIISWTSPKLPKAGFFTVTFKDLTNPKSSKVIRTVNNKSQVNLEAFSRYSVQVSSKNLPTSSKSRIKFFTTSASGVENIQITAANYTSVNLTWNALPGVSAYELNYGGATRTTTSNEITLTGLKPATTYSLVIQATNGREKGLINPSDGFTTNSAGPEKLFATSISKSGFTLNWMPLAGAESYSVYAGETLVANTNDVKYVISGLTPGTFGSYSVAGNFSNASTMESEAINVSTLIDTPSKPTIGNINSGGAAITWVLDPNATSYTINVYDALGTTLLLKAINVAGSISSVPVTGLSFSTTYSIGLVVNYQEQSSKESPLSQFTTLKPTLSGVLASNITTSTSTISWASLPSVTSYEVYKDGAAIAVGLGQNVVSFSVTGLAPGQSYKLGVRAAFIDGAKGISYTDLVEVQVITVTDSAYKPYNSSAPIINLPYGNVPIIGATITANFGVWVSTPSITSYSYQWQRSLDSGSTWSDLPASSSANYSVTVADNSFLLRTKVSATNSNGTGVAYTSAIGPVSSVYNIQVPIVRGNVISGEILEVSDGTWSSPFPITLSYKWVSSRSGLLTGQVSPTYTVTDLDVGYTISAQVTASTPHGFVAISSPARGPVTIVGNVLQPSISGTLRVGGTLNVSDGMWLNSLTGSVITYQWQSSLDGILWDSIPNATNSSLTLTQIQSGTYIRSLVFNTKSGLSVMAISIPTSVVPALNLVNYVAPVVNGAWTVGSILSTSTGTWSSNGSITYQWQSSTDGVNWTDLAAATASTYIVTVSESSKFVRAQITNSSLLGSGIAYSASRSRIGAPFNTVVPNISGTLRIGSTQTVTVGTWSNSPVSYTYQWQSSANGVTWVDISGAINATYIPSFEVANLQVRANVTATNSIGSVTIATSQLQNFSPPQATVIPRITGTFVVGQTLTSDHGTWPETIAGYAFQWQKSSDGGVTWINILGASSSTYVLSISDAGLLIRSQVSLTTNAGTSAAYSLATGVIAV